MMEYKGCAAAVEFDESVGRLHGRVVNSGSYPIATFEATDVEGIWREFHRSIDEYLESCKEMASRPENRSQASSTFDSGQICINALHARRQRAASA